MTHTPTERANNSSSTPRRLRRYLAIGVLAVVTALAPTVAVAAPRGHGSADAVARQHADAAVAALQQYYNASNGQFDTTGWWNSANALTAITDYSLQTGSTRYLSDIATTHAVNPSFVNSFNDDDGWWALAWIRAYDLTGNPVYLHTAETIFHAVAGYWDSTCGGGVWWSTGKTYKNAITNELFLSMAIQLHQRVPHDTAYLSWARKEWSWFAASGMINSSHLINDGLDASTCKNNGQTTWTYNQGVILGGLVGLYQVTGDRHYLDRATAIAHAAMSTLVDKDGVLTEPCNPITNCGADGSQFKGIFMRNLAELDQVTHDHTIRAFIDHNAASIWANDRGSGDLLGLVWQGPYQQANASTQSSALDALNAALPLTPATPAVSSLSASTLTMAPGGHGTATITVHNLSRHPIAVRLSADRAPRGLAVRLSPSRVRVGAQGTTSVTVRVDAERRAPQGFSTVTVRLRTGKVTLPARTLTVLVAAHGSLLRSFNNVGVSTDADPIPGNLDGRGGSYSAQALAAAGLRPGADVRAFGARLSWPSSPAGFPDNIRSDGQTLALHAPHDARQLVLLGASAGSPNRTITLHYSDHTDVRLAADQPDWTLYAGTAKPGQRVSTVAQMPYHNADTGTRQQMQTYVFATAIPLQAGTTLTSVTLPTGSAQASLHVFALGWSTQAAQAPAVTSLDPSTAGSGQQVTLHGTGFGAAQGQGFVTITDDGTTWGGPGSQHPLSIDRWSDTAVTVTLPTGTSLAPGTNVEVQVADSAGQLSNSAMLMITPTADPADYYTNTAVSPDTNVACADIDGLGNSYSADALAQVGVTPGGTVSSGGITYTWPDVKPCAHDDILADGQTMLVTGKPGATRLGLLGTSVNGSSSGTAIITYTDGSTSSATVSFGDWFSGPTATDTIAATTPYRNTPQGSQKLTMKLYATSVPVDPAKTVASVTLPTVSDHVASGVAAMHIFALALG